jgi:predicted TIM-barrel fold metal-dependent hydrolase
MAQAKWTIEPLRGAATVSLPTFAMPARACDAHMHVFGPEDRYPSVPDALYSLPQGNMEQYLALADRLGIERIVLVQPSYYGTDNSCLLDSLGRLGARARGVVFLPEEADAALLADLHGRGVRGVRLNLFKAQEAGDSLQVMWARISRVAAQARYLDWHLELYAPGGIVSALLERLGRLDVDYSINHLGYMTAAEGLDKADFERFVDHSRHERCWVKLSAPYRVEKSDRTERTDWMARALLQAIPERLLWGSDWPHIPNGARDTGELLVRLARWCPDEAVRSRILVDNPARLYRFDED